MEESWPFAVSSVLTISNTRQCKLVRHTLCLQTDAEIRGLCIRSREVFMQQPILLELEAPIKVCWRVLRKHDCFSKEIESCRSVVIFTDSTTTCCVCLSTVDFPQVSHFILRCFEAESIAHFRLLFFSRCKLRLHGVYIRAQTLPRQAAAM